MWAIEIASPTNNSVGGVSPDTHNAIAGNLEQGVVIDVGSEWQPGGGQSDRRARAGYNPLLPDWQWRRGGVGRVGEQLDRRRCGRGDERHLGQPDLWHPHRGPGALDNRVEANYIGTDINGTFLFGQGNPGNGQDSPPQMGNLRDGIFIDDAPDNQIGIPGGAVGRGERRRERHLGELLAPVYESRASRRRATSSRAT